MKILHTQKINKIAGSETYLLGLLPALVQKGFEVHFLILHDSKDNPKSYQGFKEKLEQNGIEVWVITFNEQLFFLKAWSIYQLINKEQYQLVVTHLIHADITISFTKFLFGGAYKLISGKHGYDAVYNAKFGFNINKKFKNTYYYLAKWAEKQVDYSFTISNALQKLYVGLGICKADKICIVPYGFDIPKKPIDNKYRFAKQQIVMVGRFIEFKGHTYALQAMAQLKKKLPNCKLVLVGDGEFRASIEKEIETLGINKEIILVGYSSEALNYMANSDIVIAPSVAEGFGIVMLEAFAQEKPFLTFDVPAFNEVIKHEVNGLLAKPFNTSDLSKSIFKCITDNKLGYSLGKNANMLYRNFYSNNYMVKRTIELYNKIIKPQKDV
jgi:glycosyltransferase involved in cell wall biosynthesis